MPEKTIFETPGAWLQVIQTANKFYFARRKNQNSVAVFLVRKSEQHSYEVLIRHQPLPLHNPETGEDMLLFACPITGGLDRPDEPSHQCALRECLEETGYDLPELKRLGSYIVGTQTDEWVDMYWADVTGIEPTEATQDGTYFESISKNEWLPIGFLYKDQAYAANQIAYLRLSKLLDL